MILFIGDVHGDLHILEKIVRERPPRVNTIIQVGDLGLWPNRDFQKHVPDIPVYWIDGNHEYFPDIKDLKEPTEVQDNFIYVPRGTILELDNRTIGFLGGAESIDKPFRTPGFDWFPEESITQRDVEVFDYDRDLDILVTHTPPATIVAEMLHIPAEKINPSAIAVETVWNAFDRPKLVCGHIHERLYTENVEVLPINGTLIL